MRCLCSSHASLLPHGSVRAFSALPARTLQRDARKAASRQAQLDAQTASLPSFSDMLRMRGLALARAPVTTVMVNIGKLCNLACRHCHVESSPSRTVENMASSTVSRVLALLAASPSVRTLDVTGGAPELNPNFQRLVAGARTLGLACNTRCNLTVLQLPGQGGTPAFLASQRVRVIASLPSTDAPTLERQRGAGVWEGSLAGLRALNAVGFGVPGSGLELDLVYNPAGARLPPPQAELEGEFKSALLTAHGLHFGRLLTLTNMPIKRFADDLVKSAQYEAYMGLLASNFNPAAVPELMCRGTLSVGWDGRLWDCELRARGGRGGGGGCTGGCRTLILLTSSLPPHAFRARARAASIRPWTYTWVLRRAPRSGPLTVFQSGKAAPSPPARPAMAARQRMARAAGAR